jgi:hypothetical protein
MRVVQFLGKSRQTDMDGPTMCSSLTLEHKERLITEQNSFVNNNFPAQLDIWGLMFKNDGAYFSAATGDTGDSARHEMNK